MALIAGLALLAQEAPTKAPAGFTTPPQTQNPAPPTVSNGLPEPPGDSFAMDQIQVDALRQMFPDHPALERVICLDIEDVYVFLEPRLVKLLRKTDIAPLQAFGSVVSVAAMQYQATWTDQQAAVPLQGLLICAVRQDGTALIITAEHAPPDEFKDSSESWAPVVNETLGLCGAA